MKLIITQKSFSNDYIEDEVEEIKEEIKKEKETFNTLQAKQFRRINQLEKELKDYKKSFTRNIKNIEGYLRDERKAHKKRLEKLNYRLDGLS